jgi:hypothetical protein
VNVWSRVRDEFPFLLGQGTKTEVHLLEELHFSHGIRSPVQVPIDGQVEHVLEEGEFPVDRRTGNFLSPLELESLNVSRVDLPDLTFCPEEVVSVASIGSSLSQDLLFPFAYSMYLAPSSRTVIFTGRRKVPLRM